MSNAFIALFLAVGVAGWAYAQLSRRSGNANPQSTLLAAIGAGLLVFVFAFTLLKFVLGF